jgi:hypothetical protein
MNAAFMLYGLTFLIGTVGIFQMIREVGPGARWICTGLFALSALGAAMDGIFTLQSGFMHFIGFGLGTGTPVLGFLVTGLVLRRIPRWRRFGNWLLLASPLTLVLLVLAQATLNVTSIEAGQGVAGLTERVLVVEIGAWYMALGWRAFRHS